MRVLGIDPGSLKMGFGIIDVSREKKRLTAVDFGVFRLNAKDSLPQRVSQISFFLKDTILKFTPSVLVLEDIFMGNNARSALILGQARGAVLAVSGLQKLPVVSFASTTVKQAVTGNGKAKKNQVGAMVSILLKLGKEPAEDAGDALALAICYTQKNVLSSVAAKFPQKRSTKKQKMSALIALSKQRAVR